jgi:hypothetical protein
VLLSTKKDGRVVGLASGAKLAGERGAGVASCTA